MWKRRPLPPGSRLQGEQRGLGEGTVLVELWVTHPVWHPGSLFTLFQPQFCHVLNGNSNIGLISENSCYKALNSVSLVSAY